MLIADCLKKAKAVLSTKVDLPHLEAEVLLSYVILKPRSYLYACPEKRMTKEQVIQYETCVLRRSKLEPLAYITGYQEFWSLPLSVNAHTLIPRPETELLVEKILALPERPNDSLCVADLGTGCGAIALALSKERPRWQVVATDVNPAALEVASHNALQLGVDVTFNQGDWCEALIRNDPFDIIISNPPYLSEEEWPCYADALFHEPRCALVSGQDGLDAINQIIQTAKIYLKPHGELWLEHGYQQQEKVHTLFKKEGYIKITSFKDLAGLPRVTKAAKPG